MRFWGVWWVENAVVFNTGEVLYADNNFCCFKLYKKWHFGKSHNHKYLNKWGGGLKSVLVRWIVDCLQFSVRVCRSACSSGSAQKVGHPAFRLGVSIVSVIILFYTFEYVVVIWRLHCWFCFSLLVLCTVSTGMQHGWDVYESTVMSSVFVLVW